MNKILNKDTDIYFEYETLKEHQKEMLLLMRENIFLPKGNFLDLACAGGIFANAFKKDFPSFQIKGIDLDTKLIAKAKENYPGLESSFSSDDCRKITANEKFDVIHASGILSVFEDFEEALTQWIDLLSENGKFFLLNQGISNQRVCTLFPEVSRTIVILKIHLQQFASKHLRLFKFLLVKIKFH